MSASDQIRMMLDQLMGTARAGLFLKFRELNISTKQYWKVKFQDKNVGFKLMAAMPVWKNYSLQMIRISFGAKIPFGTLKIK